MGAETYKCQYCTFFSLATFWCSLHRRKMRADAVCRDYKKKGG